MKSEIRLPIYISFVLDIIVSIVFGFLSIAFLITGVVYPGLRHDQQLLNSLGIWPYYSLILSAMLISTMLLTIFVFNRSLEKMLKPLSSQKVVSLSTRNFLLILPVWIGHAFGLYLLLEAILKQLIYHQSIFFTSTVISNLLFYPLSGFILGQTMIKIAKFLHWEHKNSAKVYLDLNGNLYRL